MDRARYARHLLLPEVGSEGQERLCARSVALAGDERATSVARTYLERAGVRVEAEGAGISGGETAPSPELVRRLAGREELEEAAAFLAGAFAAVEEIKRALEVGTPGRLDGVELTGPREDRG